LASANFAKRTNLGIPNEINAVRFSRAAAMLDYSTAFSVGSPQRCHCPA